MVWDKHFQVNMDEDDYLKTKSRMFSYSMCNNKQVQSISQSFINPVLCSTLALHAHKAT